MHLPAHIVLQELHPFCKELAARDPHFSLVALKGGNGQTSPLCSKAEVRCSESLGDQEMSEGSGHPLLYFFNHYCCVLSPAPLLPPHSPAAEPWFYMCKQE